MTDQLSILGTVPDLPEGTVAALYFLGEPSHYLFVSRDDPDKPDEKKMTSKFITSKDAANAFTGHDEDSGWIPDGICRAGYKGGRGNWALYFAPPQRVTLKLEGHGGITIPLPPTILFGIDQDYYLWAVKKEAFDPQAELYHAPFPNVEGDAGQICWGANQPPRAGAATLAEAWKLFFASPFSDHTVTDKSRKHREDVRKTLLELNEKQPRRYPLGDLIGGRTTVNSAVQKILSR